MTHIQLEFRGIPLHQLIDYFKELGGEQTSKSFPIHFLGDEWEGIILKEEEIPITSSFIVNAVHILFIAKNKQILDTLLKNYRKKTTRIGG